MINEEQIKTKWSNQKVPKCKIGKNHKWKGSIETAICLKCGYDVFDGCYKDNKLIGNIKEVLK
ncbi:MAG: hypothetical protein PHD04_03380 [Candidatus Pacebacteria bacterium]|nr:hypothetical protein [Candidatus Paceibacterota bacterium]